ncbi:MAG: hypothetical protein FWG58_04370 [Methanomassiliicoccaceae archaeon]|nr:hypothetical protein [Methanomassiliicoccaceae archaeon]
MEADNLKRRSVAKGAPILILGILIMAAAAVYVFLNPDILDSISHIVMIIATVIASVALIVVAVMIILAVPFYVFKGEKYQDGRSYDLKDVKPVRETSDRKDKEE